MTCFLSLTVSAHGFGLSFLSLLLLPCNDRVAAQHVFKQCVTKNNLNLIHNLLRCAITILLQFAAIFELKIKFYKLTKSS
jgi:hypothetical protein